MSETNGDNMEFWHFLLFLPFMWLIKWPFLHFIKENNDAPETTPESAEQFNPIIMIFGMFVWLFVLWLLWPKLPWSS
jgi:hypothetical protein